MPKPEKVVLPWMRVPMYVAKGQGVPLERVQGMHGELLAALRAGKGHAMGVRDWGYRIEGQGLPLPFHPRPIHPQPLTPTPAPSALLLNPSGGYSELFPVQAAAWHVLAGGMSARHDLCVAAPTGSGKTLAYALPVLQRCVAARSLEHTRALVVLPTRDLAQQVYRVFKALCGDLPVSVGLVNGCGSVGEEANMLAGAPASAGVATWSTMLPMAHTVATGGLTNVDSARGALLAFPPTPREASHAGAGCSGHGMKRARDGAGRPVTVLVATPGRLVHHLQHTPALDLSELEFLVLEGLGLPGYAAMSQAVVLLRCLVGVEASRPHAPPQPQPTNPRPLRWLTRRTACCGRTTKGGCPRCWQRRTAAQLMQSRAAWSSSSSPPPSRATPPRWHA